MCRGKGRTSVSGLEACSGIPVETGSKLDPWGWARAKATNIPRLWSGGCRCQGSEKGKSDEGKCWEVHL